MTVMVAIRVWRGPDLGHGVIHVGTGEISPAHSLFSLGRAAYCPPDVGRRARFRRSRAAAALYIWCRAAPKRVRRRLTHHPAPTPLKAGVFCIKVSLLTLFCLNYSHRSLTAC